MSEVCWPEGLRGVASESAGKSALGLLSLPRRGCPASRTHLPSVWLKACDRCPGTTRESGLVADGPAQPTALLAHPRLHATLHNGSALRAPGRAAPAHLTRCGPVSAHLRPLWSCRGPTITEALCSVEPAGEMAPGLLVLALPGSRAKECHSVSTPWSDGNWTWDEPLSPEPRPRASLVLQKEAGTESCSLYMVLLRIQPKILQCWRPMRRSFKSYDEGGTGLLSVADFRKVLRQYSINLSEEEFFHVLEYYDKTLSSRVAYNDFLRAFLQ
ncbi:Hypothetical predicted protein [Marmota monax]|uniref:EF-hand domain-containing protein n=1 Tax=Marmota monax TaxID=9995 RepID=A0A5E4CIS2_MARMO|nr:Hypothetical predicted protein [Marmota monax]